MKDFDVQRAAREDVDRTFRLCRRDMRYRAHVPPEAITPWEDYNPAVQTAAEGVSLMDSTVETFLEEDSVAAWREIRRDPVDTPSIDDINNLIQWLAEQQALRPLENSAPSSESPEASGIGSTENSSSPAEAVSAG